MDAVRVMIAQTSDVVADRLKKVIESDGRMVVVATASSGQETIRAATSYRPTVIVMDLRFPDMGSGRIIRQLSESRLHLAVLVCSAQAVKGSPVLDQAVQAGAFEFIKLPDDVEQIATIGRQIQTAIFVASFSKTKQIPRAPTAQAVTAEEAQARQDRLAAVVIDSAADAFPHLMHLLSRVRPQAEPVVIAVLRKAAPAATEFLTELKPHLHTQASVGKDGDELIPGRITLLDEAPGDRVVERTPDGRLMLRAVSGANKKRGESGPAPAVLYVSLGTVFAETSAVVVLGRPSHDTTEALVAAKEKRVLTLVEERSTSMLQQIATKCPAGTVPDDIVSVEQIDTFINAVLITPKA